MKEHKKLYKSGKLWMTATVMALAAGTTMATTTAHADATPANNTTSEAQSTDQQKAAQDKQQQVSNKTSQATDLQNKIDGYKVQVNDENTNYQNVSFKEEKANRSTDSSTSGPSISMTTYYYGDVTINMPDGQQEKVPRQQISITGSGTPTEADLADKSFKDVPLPSFNGYTPQVNFRVEPADNTDPMATIVKEKSGYVLKFPQLKLNLSFYDYVVNYVPQYSNYTSQEHIYVYGPDSDGSTGIADFDKKVAQQTINHNMNGNQYLNHWSTANFTSQQLVDVLGGHDFVNEKTGYRNQALPTYAGYHPVITFATASYQYHEGVPGFTQSELVAFSSKLVAELNAYLKDHPNATTLPEYSVDMPLNVAFYIHYVKDAVPTPNPSPNDDHHEETVLPGPASSNNNQRSIDQLASVAKIVNSYSGNSTFTSLVVSDSSHTQRQSKQLPQTGNKTNLSVIGLGAVSFLGMLGFAGLSKKQR